MKEIYDQIQQRGVDPAKDDLQIMRVSGKGSRTNDYDYIVFKKE